MKLITTTNKALRETTVTATDAQGRFICCETMSGISTRVTTALSQQVRAAADRLTAQATIKSASSISQARQLAQRLR